MPSSTFFPRILKASGQQHGSVYWADGAAGLLARLDPSLPLQPQLADAFAVSESPIWMDSSTSRQCEQREQAVGGALELAKISGSRAFERFTGNQIAALADSRGSHLDGIERIGLVSSFVASLLAGKYVLIRTSGGNPPYRESARGHTDGLLRPSHSVISRCGSLLLSLSC